MSRCSILVAGGYDGRSRRRLEAQMSAFATAHGQSSRIISFLEPETAAIGGGVRIEHWVDALPYGEYIRLWRAAYARLDEMLSRLPARGAELLTVFYHYSADTLLRCLVLQRCLEEESPLLLVVPEAAMEGYRPLGVPVFRVDSSIRHLFRTRMHGVSIGRIVRADVRRLARRLVARRKQRAGPSPGESSGSRTILVAVEDNISGVNYGPARSIIDLLRGAGQAVAAVTSSQRLAEEFARCGVSTVFCGTPPLRFPWLSLLRARRTIGRELRRLAGDRFPSGPEAAFLRLLDGRIFRHLAYYGTVRARLSRCAADREVGAVLAVNEGTPLAVAALKWAQARAIPDLGYWPALMGERPDYDFFPASRHLVYGDQIRDRMIAQGISPDSIRSVGSVTFDGALGRDKDRDVEATRVRILRHWKRGDQLAVVATEALPNPLGEIDAAVRALLGLERVHVVIKVHPADSLEFYRRYAAGIGTGSRLEVVKSCDLLALLHAADLLICVMSNIIVTAGVLGTPTVVCDFGNKRRVLDFVAEGLCPGCFEPGELPGMLHAMLRNGDVREHALRQLCEGLRRFNGPNDGRASQRVADELIASAGARGRGRRIHDSMRGEWRQRVEEIPRSETASSAPGAR